MQTRNVEYMYVYIYIYTHTYRYMYTCIETLAQAPFGVVKYLGLWDFALSRRRGALRDPWKGLYGCRFNLVWIMTEASGVSHLASHSKD